MKCLTSKKTNLMVQVDMEWKINEVSDGALEDKCRFLRIAVVP